MPETPCNKVFLYCTSLPFSTLGTAFGFLVFICCHLYYFYWTHEPTLTGWFQLKVCLSILKLVAVNIWKIFSLKEENAWSVDMAGQWLVNSPTYSIFWCLIWKWTSSFSSLMINIWCCAVCLLVMCCNAPYCCWTLFLIKCVVCVSEASQI